MGVRTSNGCRVPLSLSLSWVLVDLGLWSGFNRAGILEPNREWENEGIFGICSNGHDDGGSLWKWMGGGRGAHIRREKDGDGDGWGA